MMFGERKMEDRFESNPKFNKVAHLITGAVIHITVDYEEDKKILSEASRENGCKVQFFENADEHMLWAEFDNNNAITAEPSDDYQHVNYELTDLFAIPSAMTVIYISPREF